MSEKDSKQTLITKQDDLEWAKVLHGEIVADDENDAHAEAQLVRNYLIARDEVVALKEVSVSDDLNVLSAEEAKVIYQKASSEIHSRATSPFDRVKGFLAPATIGALSLAVVLLALPDEYKAWFGITSTTTPQTILSSNGGLDFSRYSAIGMGEDPGDYPNMLLIPNGQFTMGCTLGWDDVVGCRPNESPPHEVVVDAFELAQHEVTVRQFKKFTRETGYLTDAEKESRGCVHRNKEIEGPPFLMSPEITWRNPGFFQEDQHPVVCISWNDTQAYIAWLSEQHGRQYRLPTEAEWEFASRGGKANAYSWGGQADSSFANYNSGDEATEFTTVVGNYPANKYSIQDMSGNVWEWVQDCWHENYVGAPSTAVAWMDNCSLSENHARRGGAWDARPQGIRSANRSGGAKTDRSVYYGFRVAHDYEKN